MGKAPEVSLAEFLAEYPYAAAAFEKVTEILDELGPYEIRVTKSQIAFRRRRGFAFIWTPGRYLTKPNTEVVLSIDLDHHDPSPRFKEVVHPAPNHWMHHLEIHDLDELDDEVTAWLAEAAHQAN